MTSIQVHHITPLITMLVYGNLSQVHNFINKEKTKVVWSKHAPTELNVINDAKPLGIHKPLGFHKGIYFTFKCPILL